MKLFGFYTVDDAADDFGRELELLSISAAQLCRKHNREQSDR
ncbi:hypothetical protein FHS14_000277 [Paenibacillus baekrokdamisoli]|nr:hypothetical protein [Paenibacillus baekrokdamisoli]